MNKYFMTLVEKALESLKLPTHLNWDGNEIKSFSISSPYVLIANKPCFFFHNAVKDRQLLFCIAGGISKSNPENGNCDQCDNFFQTRPKLQKIKIIKKNNKNKENKRNILWDSGKGKNQQYHVLYILISSAIIDIIYQYLTINANQNRQRFVENSYL